MTRPLALILILSLAFVAARAAPPHRRHHRSHHLVIEMKDNGQGRRGGPALARADHRGQPGAIRRRLGAKGAVASVGFTRGQGVAHPEELNGPGAARFDHADSTVGAKVSVPF